MLAFTRKTDYALIALTHLALHRDDCNSAREISSLYGIPLPLLMNILKLMTQKGLAASVRGPRGGYRLARSAEQITLNDIIGAVEGPVQLVQCVDWYENKRRGKLKTGCDIMGVCPVRPTIHTIHAKLVEFLAGVTLADVIHNHRNRPPEPSPEGQTLDCSGRLAVLGPEGLAMTCLPANGGSEREKIDLS